MATITIKLNTRSKAGKALQDILDVFSKEPGVEIIHSDSSYSPDFVHKIKKSEQQIKEGKFKVLNTDDVWGSLGL
jgi:RNA binding exosome subunit